MNDIEKICVRKLPIYCKKCGKIIDDDTNVCTGCGRKYFNIGQIFNWKFFLILILSISIMLNVYLTYFVKRYSNNIKMMNVKLADVTQAYDEKEIAYSKVRKDNKDLRQENLYNDELIDTLQEKSSELNVYQKYFSFVAKDGKKYHKYSCSHIKNKDTLYEAITVLERNGFTPCEDCYK